MQTPKLLARIGEPRLTCRSGTFSMAFEVSIPLDKDIERRV